MTDPFVPQVCYTALKPMIKHQTLSLQVSNAGGFEQATAYISLLTLHSTSTIMNKGVCKGGVNPSLSLIFYKHLLPAQR